MAHAIPEYGERLRRAVLSGQPPQARAVHFRGCQVAVTLHPEGSREGTQGIETAIGFSSDCIGLWAKFAKSLGNAKNQVADFESPWGRTCN